MHILFNINKKITNFYKLSKFIKETNDNIEQNNFKLIKKYFLNS